MTTPTLPSTTTIRYVGPCPACSRDCTWTQATTDPYPTPHCGCEETS